MEVGQKIKLVRLHRGLTQKQLGDLLNLGDGGANRIAQYEIGYRVPKPSLLKEIAKVLDVKEETFFVSDKFLPDILRTIMWYDFEHSTEEDRWMCWRSSVCSIYRKKRKHSVDLGQAGNGIREEALL